MAILPAVLILGGLLQAPVAPPTAAPTIVPGPAVLLERKFRAGEVTEVQVSGELNGEQRFSDPETGFRLETFLPFQERIQYRFSTQVLALKADGIADVRYRRPTMTLTSGPNDEGEMETSTERINLDLRMELSPINEMLKAGPFAAPAPAKPARSMRLLTPSSLRVAAQDGPPFVTEILRLALFQGSLDSSLDLSPRLPYEEVKPGDTWKRTVGYSPQPLPGKEGKSAVQRLDYVFTYLGRVTENGVATDRIRAELKLDTDATGFINQELGLKADESPIEKYPLKLQATIDWRLDTVTRATVRADAKSQGEFMIKLKEITHPLVEMRFTGSTTLRPVGATKPAPRPTPRPAPRRR